MKKKIIIGIGVVLLALLVKLCFFQSDLCDQIDIRQTVIVSDNDSIYLNTEARIEANGKSILIYWHSVVVEEDTIAEIRQAELNRVQSAIGEQGCL